MVFDKSYFKKLTESLAVIFFLFTLTVLFYGVARAENENEDEYTPMAEIIEIVQNSGEFEYHETYFDPARARHDYESQLKQADPNIYVIKKEGNKQVNIYEPSEKVAGLINEALTLKERGKSGDAVSKLKEALEIEPNYFMIPVCLAELYYSVLKYDDALLWADRAIVMNPAASRAYKVKADYYYRFDKYENAKENLIYAIIYNRNYNGAWEMLEKIGKKTGFKIYDKPFVPLYSLERMDNGKIRIYMDQDEIVRWMPYSFCKAVWRYHQGYFEKKTGGNEYMPTVGEEMECLSNTLYSYDAFLEKGEFEKDELLERLKEIRDRFFLEQFVYFDVMAPKDPGMLAGLPDKKILDLVDYINEFILIEKDNE